MRIAQGKRSRVNFAFAAHDDGTVSIALSVNRAKLKAEGNKFVMVDFLEGMPLELSVNGLTMRPRVMLRAWCKANKNQMERLKWEQLKTLCKT